MGRCIQGACIQALTKSALVRAPPSAAAKPCGASRWASRTTGGTARCACTSTSPRPNKAAGVPSNSTRPASITTVRVAYSAIRRMSWVIRSTVPPWRLNAATAAISSCWLRLSSPPVGSSSTSTRGRAAMTAASATCRRWLDPNRAGGRCDWPTSRKRSSASATRRATSAWGRACRRRAKAVSSATVAAKIWWSGF